MINIYTVVLLIRTSFVHHYSVSNKIFKTYNKKSKTCQNIPRQIKKDFELTINSQVFSKEIIFKLVRTAIRNHNQSVIYPTQEEHNRRKCNCIWKNRMYFIVSGYSLGQNGNMLIYIKVQLIIYFYYNSLNVLT